MISRREPRIGSAAAAWIKTSAPSHSSRAARGVAHVAAHLGDVAFHRVVDRHHVERAHVVAARDEEAREVQAEKAGASGDGVRRYRWTVTASVGRGTGCGGGFESTSTAAASSTAIPTEASPSRLRESLFASGCPRSTSGRPNMWCTPPHASATETSDSFTSRTCPYVLRPEVRELRQAEDAEVHAGGDEQRDQHRRQPRVAQERLPAQLGRERPDDERELHEPAEPEARRREVHPVRELRLPRRARVGGRVPGEREPRGEHERERERDPQQHAPLEQPREVERRRDEREAERHRDERGAEARPARDRRQIAVQQSLERKLQRVLRAQEERDDADLEHRDDAEPRHLVEARLRARGQRAAHDQQPEAEAADQQHEREEVRPAHDVLGARRAGRAVRLRRRRRRDADAERPDARDDVPVGRDGVPAHGVRAARKRPQPRRHHVRVGAVPRDAGDDRPGCRLDDDRVRQRLHALVEAHPDRPRPALEALPVRRLRRTHARMRERDARQRERQERDGDERLPHRCGCPASGDRWPKTGARSRSA